MTRSTPRNLVLVSASALALSACAHGTPPPEISLDESVPAVAAEATKPVEVVAVPTPLPLPGQLKPPPRMGRSEPEPADPKARVALANRAARVQPSRYGYVNATQVWPYAAGALYQLYASPGKVTDIALQEGEQLVSVSAGDTVRWVIGDTTSGTGNVGLELTRFCGHRHAFDGGVPDGQDQAPIRAGVPAADHRVGPRRA